MEQFKEASVIQLGRLLRVINYYEPHAGGPSLDWLLTWANGETQAPEKTTTTEHTIRYWEELMDNGEGHS